MFVSPAYAQAAGMAGGGDLLQMLLPFVLVIAVFYFLLIRPQQKRMKDHKAKLDSIRRGDSVVTGGGLVGRVSKVREGDELEVEIAAGTRVVVLRSLVHDVLSKSAPAPAAAPRKRGKGKSKAEREEAEADDAEDADAEAETAVEERAEPR